MANTAPDTVTVTFTRPVRIDKKRYGKTSPPTPIDAGIAEMLILSGAAEEVQAPKEPAKKA